jgi:hypothetical protein
MYIDGNALIVVCIIALARVAFSTVLKYVLPDVLWEQNAGRVELQRRDRQDLIPLLFR